MAIPFLAQDNGVCIHKATHAINMPMGVIAGNAVVHPEHRRRAQRLGKNGFILDTPQAEIPDLPMRIKQARFRGQERPGTIDLKTAAFQHHGSVVVCNRHDGAIEMAGDLDWDLIVGFPVSIPRPGVEPKPRDPAVGRWFVSRDKQRATVTKPASIRRDPIPCHLRTLDSSPLQYPLRPLLVPVRLNQYPHGFPSHDLSYDLSVHPMNRGQFPRPIGLMMRPGQPGGCMRLPFCWQPIPTQRMVDGSLPQALPARASHPVNQESVG